MTSALKACLRRNLDETGLLKDNMEDGNSKKILSVSLATNVFLVNEIRVCSFKVNTMHIMMMYCIAVAVLTSPFLVKRLHCFNERRDDNDICRVALASKESFECAVRGSRSDELSFFRMGHVERIELS